METNTKALISCALKLNKIKFIRLDNLPDETLISMFGHLFPVYDQKIKEAKPVDINVNIFSDNSFRDQAENAAIAALKPLDGTILHEEIMEALTKTYIEPDETLHLCVGFYNNGQFKTNTVKGKNLADNIEYNLTMRPGRFYFVDGEHVGGGMLKEPYQTETVNKYKTRIKELGLKPANHDTAPYE